MNTVEFMKVLANCSKSKTNKELAIMASLGLLVVGGICYYYYTNNEELKRLNEKYTGQISDMSSQISSLKGRNSSMQNQVNKLHQKNNDLMASLKKCESTVANKDDKDRS
jgi:hypothetical protein